MKVTPVHENSGRVGPPVFMSADVTIARWWLLSRKNKSVFRKSILLLTAEHNSTLLGKVHDPASITRTQEAWEKVTSSFNVLYPHLPSRNIAHVSLARNICQGEFAIFPPKNYFQIPLLISLPLISLYIYLLNYSVPQNMQFNSGINFHDKNNYLMMET